MNELLPEIKMYIIYKWYDKHNWSCVIHLTKCDDVRVG